MKAREKQLRHVSNGSGFSSRTWGKLTSVLAVGGVLALSTIAKADTLPKVMALGDSITAGQQEDSNRNGAYRTSLYDLLDRNGYHVDFVGSMRSPNPFDGDNEGHGGWKASHLAGDETPPFSQTGSVSVWIPQYNPDVILCMAGVNDYFSGADDNTVESHIQSLINKCFQYAPNARVIVGSMTNSSSDTFHIPNINSMTKTFVTNLANQGKKISFLDMYTPLSRSTDISSDGTHPTVSGYNKIANIWYTELTKYISKPNGTGSPYGGKAWNIPGRVEAENYDFGADNTGYHDNSSWNEGGVYRNGGVDISTCSEGGYKVGWTASGEWLTYTVNVATAGNHTLTLRYAGTGTGSVQVSFGGVDKTGSVSLPSSGDWNKWVDKTVTVNLSAGVQLMRVNITGSGFDLNYLAFDAPTGVTATAGNGQVALTWNAVPGAAKYRVKRSTTNGSGYSWVVSNWGSTNYTNTGLTNGTTYYFVITSQDANGNEMADSSQVAATPSASTSGTNLMSNPGFEAEQYGTQTPSGWSESSSVGGTNSGYTESYGGSHGGSYHATHYNGSAYNMYTYQAKTGLANGLYTLRCWARSSGGQNQCYLEAKDFGGTAKTANLPTGSSYQLVEIKDINVTNGQCTIGIWSSANAGNWVYFDDFEFFKQ